jgi:aldehyde dehydrogenase (NAD+)
VHDAAVAKSEEISMKTKSILEALDLNESNPGACTGSESWLSTKDAAELVSVNPTTGEALGKVRMATAGDYDQVLNKSIENFKTWRTTPAPKRGLLIRDLGMALREKCEPLGEMVSLEMGKIRAEGIGEVQEMIDVCDFAVGLSRQLCGSTMHSERPGHRMYEQWHPLGPVGIISAFNFPVAVWAWNAALAATCGNTMVWKPSPSTPLVSVAVQHICNRVMADHGLEGIFNLLVGSNETIGDRMVADARFPLISFTGSVAVGRQVAQVVAGRLGRSLLELGGNNAIIVASDADLDLAVRAIVFGAVGTAGQRCTSTRRVLVHKDQMQELSERLVRAYSTVSIGDPLDTKTLMGPLASAGSVDTMMAAIEQAKQEGGELVTGGKRLPEVGPFHVQPTIMQMPITAPIMKEETFAPLLYLTPYDSLDQAIEAQNDVPQGLSSAIFTRGLMASEEFLSASGSDCGIANVNIGTSGAEIGGAFGGEKDTGGGRESGSDSWKSYMRRQTCTINWSGKLPLAQGVEFG